MNILKNNAKKVLLSDWLCPEIIDRTEETEEIKKSIINVLLEEHIPPICFIYGASGTGKTFTIKRMFEDNFIEIKKHLPMFNYFYFNAREFEVASLHSFWVFLAKKLEKHLPVYSKYFNRKINYIVARGWQTDEYKEVIKEIIIQNRLSIVIIIDEVDKMDIKDFESLVYQIYNFNEFGDGLDYMGISVIAISNKINFLKMLEKAVFDRIGIKIHFKSYTADDLFKILKIHAKYSLVEGSYDDLTLVKIAKAVFDTSTSARDVKLTLYNLAKLCDNKLDSNLIDKAFEETKKDLMREEIRVRPFHHRITLYAIVKYYKEVMELEEQSKNLNLFKYAVNIPTKSNVYKVYVDLCKEYSEKPKGYRVFFDIIDDLDKKGLIRTEIKSLGRARGITTLIYPAESVEFLEPIIKETMGW